MKLFTQEEIVERIKEVYSFDEYETFRVHRTSDNKCLYGGMVFILTNEGIKHIDGSGNYHDDKQINIVIANIISGEQYLEKYEFNYIISVKDLAAISGMSVEEASKAFQTVAQTLNNIKKIKNQI